MAQPVGMVGIDPAELGPLRTVVSLLRHPDPEVGELTRQALIYLQDLAARKGVGEPDVLDFAG